LYAIIPYTEEGGGGYLFQMDIDSDDDDLNFKTPTPNKPRKRIRDDNDDDNDEEEVRAGPSSLFGRAGRGGGDGGGDGGDKDDDDGEEEGDEEEGDEEEEDEEEEQEEEQQQQRRRRRRGRRGPDVVRFLDLAASASGEEEGNEEEEEEEEDETQGSLRGFIVNDDEEEEEEQQQQSQEQEEGGGGGSQDLLLHHTHHQVDALEREAEGEDVERLVARYRDQEREDEYNAALRREEEEEEAAAAALARREEQEVDDRHLSERSKAIRDVINGLERKIKESLERDHEEAVRRAVTTARAEVGDEKTEEDDDGIVVVDEEDEAQEEPVLPPLYGGFTPQFAYGFSNQTKHRKDAMKKARQKRYLFNRQRVANGGGGEDETKQSEIDLIYRLNPSSIAEYFSSHQCQFNLIMNNLIRDTNKATYRHVSQGLLEGKEDKQVFDALNYVERSLGSKYEAEVVDKLKYMDYHVHVRDDDDDDGGGGDNDDDNGDDDSLWAMAVLHSLLARCEDEGEVGKVEFIYQANLSVDLSHMIMMGNDHHHHHNGYSIRGPSVFKPDIIEASFQPRGNERRGCKLRLRMVEIKASERIQSKHRIQLGLYAIMMKEWLLWKGYDDDEIELDIDEAGVWLLDGRWYETTAIDTLHDDLRHFLCHDLIPVLAHPQGATKCGQCRVCGLLARAKRGQYGVNLVGTGEEVMMEDLPLCRLLNAYDLNTLQELRALAWPHHDHHHHQQEPSIRQLIDSLPRLCHLYLAGPFNNPFHHEVVVNGVEVDGDPGWSSHLLFIDDHMIEETMDMILLDQLQGLGMFQQPLKMVVVVVNQRSRSVRRVVGTSGNPMAFRCIHQDYMVKEATWVEKEEDVNHVTGTLVGWEGEGGGGDGVKLLFHLTAYHEGDDDDNTQDEDPVDVDDHGKS